MEAVFVNYQKEESLAKYTVQRSKQGTLYTTLQPYIRLINFTRPIWSRYTVLQHDFLKAVKPKKKNPCVLFWDFRIKNAINQLKWVWAFSEDTVWLKQFMSVRRLFITSHCPQLGTIQAFAHSPDNYGHLNCSKWDGTTRHHPSFLRKERKGWDVS